MTLSSTFASLGRVPGIHLVLSRGALCGTVFYTYGFFGWYRGNMTVELSVAWEKRRPAAVLGAVKTGHQN